MTKKTISINDQELPWEGKKAHSTEAENDNDVFTPDKKLDDPSASTLSMYEVSELIDQMIMDIQHLELEIVRARYRLSFHLPSPYDEYMRAEIFSSMGTRYGGNQVYDQYLSLRGYSEYEDAIDTPFHVNRMQRIARGYDEYPDLYP